VLHGCRIGPGAHVRRAILAGGVQIGANTIVEDGVVLGEGVEVGADCILSHGMKVFPHTTLPDGAIRF
jgi:mannose-1-phosphate guanylyltransferase